jgi:hypothetical protein
MLTNEGTTQLGHAVLTLVRVNFKVGFDYRADFDFRQRWFH